MRLLIIWELSKLEERLKLLKLIIFFSEKIWVELINCPWVGRLKLAASVGERPLTTESLTRSRNSYAVSPQILRTNESNLRNYLFNKIFVRNPIYMHFPIPSFEQRKNLRKKLENVGNKEFLQYSQVLLRLVFVWFFYEK